ncbi:MAG TPA: hypothetical protein VN744_08025 [Casimicrobiaceae bacterium]|nr:hypothetical protein [Casimicrobiaceae bacterium]
MKLPICLALAMLLSACIPIGIRGTSITDAGAQRAIAASPAGAADLPAPGAPDPRRG